MKKALLTFGLFGFLLFGATAQTNDGTGTQAQIEDPDAPEITFEETVIDYGEIEQGSDPYRVFKFKNTGKKPLIISNARGSCGCTVPTWPKEPIKPGETGEIKVRYDTKRIGVINKTVTITSNAKTPTGVLRIKGKVLAPKTSPEKPANNAPVAKP